MVKYAHILLFIVLALVSLGAWGHDMPADTIAPVDSVERLNKFQQLKARAQQRIEEKKNEPWDTIRDGTYWWRALKHGKIDLTGETIQYPKFLRFAWRVYKWGDKAFNSYDSSYVVSTGKNWKFMFKSNIWNDNYQGEPSVKDMHVDMRSKLAANAGFQLSFMAVSVGYTLGITNLINGEKVSNKIDFSFTCARFAAEGIWRTATQGLRHECLLFLQQSPLRPGGGLLLLQVPEAQCRLFYRGHLPAAS